MFMEQPRQRRTDFALILAGSLGADEAAPDVELPIR